MTNETTENLLKAMREFQWSEPRPIFYRLYHDDQGRPLFYTMEDLPGTYIEVDQQTYVTANRSVKVVDGKLIVIEPKTQVTKLKPTQGSGVCCDPRNVCVVVSSDRHHQRWSQSPDDQD